MEEDVTKAIKDRILLSPGGDSIFKHQRQANEMIVGTVDGVFVLVDNGEEWNIVHRALEGCFVSALTALANGALIAGLRGQGLARSDDGGRSWRWTNSGLTQFDVWSARAGTIGGKEVVFAGTMPAALFRSDDGGETWRALPGLDAVPGREQWTYPPPPHLGHVKDIVIADDKLYVSIEVGALLLSEDGGESFRALPVHSDPTGCDLHRVLVHPGRPGRITIASGLGVMTSADSGETWRRGPAPPGLDYPDPAVLHPDDPDLIFVGGGVGWPPQWYARARAMGKIARSRDAGMSWERLLGGLPDGQRPVFSALSLAAFDDGFAVYAGDSDGQIYESVDGGDRWSMIAELAPVSKGDFYKGLAKGRPRLANVDDLKFSGQMAFMDSLVRTGG